MNHFSHVDPPPYGTDENRMWKSGVRTGSDMAEQFDRVALQGVGTYKEEVYGPELHYVLGALFENIQWPVKVEIAPHGRARDNMWTVRIVIKE